MKLHDQFDAICFGVCATVAITAAAIGCTDRQVAKDEYSVQSHACVQIYEGDPASQRACLDYVRKKWDAAGAKPAATDGGVQ